MSSREEERRSDNNEKIQTSINTECFQNSSSQLSNLQHFINASFNFLWFIDSLLFTLEKNTTRDWFIKTDINTYDLSYLQVALIGILFLKGNVKHNGNSINGTNNVFGGCTFQISFKWSMYIFMKHPLHNILQINTLCSTQWENNFCL